MVSPWRSDITGPLHFVSFASEVNATVVSLLYTLLLSVWRLATVSCCSASHSSTCLKI